jgi:hypothetical protein
MDDSSPHTMTRHHTYTRLLCHCGFSYTIPHPLSSAKSISSTSPSSRSRIDLESYSMNVCDLNDFIYTFIYQRWTGRRMKGDEGRGTRLGRSTFQSQVNVRYWNALTGTSHRAEISQRHWEVRNMLSGNIVLSKEISKL